jgi:hypothetical protein
MSLGPWERFATRFSIAFLVLYVLIAATVTQYKATNERYIFPISRMPMFSGIKVIDTAQQERLERLRGE